MKNLPSCGSDLPRPLIIQLARLGDLVQSLPVISALRTKGPHASLDLLCPSPLASLGSHFPGISNVLSWNGRDWYELAKTWSGKVDDSIARALQLLEGVRASPFTVAYNLNNHPRAILAAHLLARHVTGPGSRGPLSPNLTPWVEYLRLVASHRGNNRVHLADAFCGLCGVSPPTEVPSIEIGDSEVPESLRDFREREGFGLALVVGAGDSDRRVSIKVWVEFVNQFLTHCPEGKVLFVGGPGERELVNAMESQISPMLLGRIWDACGRATLPQLSGLLSQCRWVVGSDTGPLHLGAACGAQAIGWYFSQARVHETGPYGEGHWVWQAEGETNQPTTGNGHNGQRGAIPTSWPIQESVELMLRGTCSSIPKSWSLWQGHRDQKGMYFTEYESSAVAPQVRDQIWQCLGHSSDVNWEVIKDLLREPVPAFRS